MYVKRRYSFLLIILSLLLVFQFGCSNNPKDNVSENGSGGNGEVIELTWACFMPETNEQVIHIKKLYFDKVEELANGQLKFKFLGPEVFGAGEIGPAVQGGVVDFGIVFVGAYEGIVPGVAAVPLRRVSLEEERKPGGAYDYLLEMHKKAGLYYLGRPFPINPEVGFFNVWLNKKMEHPKDFAGTSIGGTAAARAPVQKWGGSWVDVSIPEYYSALEHGVVDGVTAYPALDVKDTGLYEVVKYAIKHRYNDCTLGAIMNLERLNSLPQHLQDLIVNTFIESEKELEKVATGLVDEAWDWLVNEGNVEPIEFPPDVAEQFVTDAYESQWEFQAQRFPEVTADLKKLLTNE